MDHVTAAPFENRVRMSWATVGRMRLLPDDRQSWTRYVWLVYLALPITFFIVVPASPWLRALDALGIVAFVPMYFWGYWIPGIGFSILIGGINIHYSELRRADEKLKVAQADIVHLAAVAERERIARDLHDLLGHTLSVIVLKAELASRLAGSDAARVTTTLPGSAVVAVESA